MLSRLSSVTSTRLAADDLAVVVRELQEVRVSKRGTSLITLLVPGGYSMTALTSFLKHEGAVAGNIKSRV